MQLPRSRRADTIRSVAAYSPATATQAAARAASLRILRASARPLDRSSADGHVTASAVVLREDDGAVLLTLHARYRKWLQLGGHVEQEDLSVVTAALREAHEESGLPDLAIDPDLIDIDLHAAACPEPGRHVDLRFLALAPAGAAPVATAESEQVAWFAPGQEPDDLDPAVARAVAAARKAWQERHREAGGRARLLRRASTQPQGRAVGPPTV